MLLSSIISYNKNIQSYQAFQAIQGWILGNNPNITGISENFLAESDSLKGKLYHWYPWMITDEKPHDLSLKFKRKASESDTALLIFIIKNCFTHQFPPAAWFILLLACTSSVPSSPRAERQRRTHVLLDKQPWPYASAAVECAHTRQVTFSPPPIKALHVEKKEEDGWGNNGVGGKW